MDFLGLGNILYKLLLIFIGLLGINFLVAFHELGHFLFCKLFKIKTPSFSIGFGPYLWSKKIGETIFALSSLPLGGYVEIAGIQEVGQGEQKEASRKDQFSFVSKPYYQKLLVLLGGILFNMIFSYVTFTALFLTGIPKTVFLYPYQVKPIISKVVPQSTAEKAGLMPQDKIIAINNQPIHNNFITLLGFLKPVLNTPVIRTIERDEQQKDIEITIAQETNNKNPYEFFAGAELEQHATPSSPFSEAIKKSITATNTFFVGTFLAFKNMFAQKTTKGLGGPLMIIQQTVKGASQGSKIFFLLLAIISINLAVLNLLPLPVLDGGQVLFYSIEALIRRPLPEKAKAMAHYVCWMALIVLALYLSFKDIISILKASFNL